MNAMAVLRSILCPVDFSDQSRQALRWAEALSRRTAGRLTVLSAVDPLLAEAARLRLGLDLAHTETEPALRQFVAATWSDDITRRPLRTSPYAWEIQLTSSYRPQQRSARI